jgi:hypothetical protein
MKRRAGRWKSALAKLLLLLVSLSMAVAFVEVLVLPRLMQNPPLKLQRGFTHTMQILTQSSKQGMLPQDYILILGDSYARGYGDWLDTANRDGNPSYHSAHVLQELMGRDVLSFGKGGAGSIAGTVITPGRQFKVLQQRGLEAPRTVLVYFYEGNDYWNNLRYLRRNYYDDYDRERVLEDDYFDAFLQDEYDSKADGPIIAERVLTFGYIKGLWKSMFREGKDPMHPGEVNRVVIDGGPVAIPDEAQSPGLEFDDGEFRIAAHIADRSLRKLKTLFPAADIHIVYIAAPLSLYEIASETVSVQTYLRRDSIYPAASVAEFSDRIRAEMKDLAQRYEVGFLDPTDFLRAEARQRAIHGPGDWKHFNEDGYRLLGQAIAHYLQAGFRSPDVPID